MPIRNLILALCAVLATGALAHAETVGSSTDLIKQPKPEFPQSELRRAREGWVLVNYKRSDDGSVVDPSVVDSSHSKAFDKAALKAVQDWRYEPGEHQQQSALLNFVYDRRHTYVTRKFYFRDGKIHDLIDSDEIEKAQEEIDSIRRSRDLTAVELAYTYIAESRIAGKRKDRAEQLRCFRRAMLNDGRWLSRDTYLKALRVAVLLEVDQGDFASAVRDYELLSETGTGRELAADLEPQIEAIRAQISSGEIAASPHRVANSVVTVSHEVPRGRTESGFTNRPGPDDRATTPYPSKKQ
jgi:TonB family protein